MSEPSINHNSLKGSLNHELDLNSERRFTLMNSVQNNHINENNESKQQQEKSQQKFQYKVGQQVKSNNQLSTNLENNSQKGVGHPMACIATVFFKGAALFFYLFTGITISNVITFIIVIVLSALDFWTVKNITGRMLVGLMWWSQYDDEGKQIWRFCSSNNNTIINAIDETFFWVGQITGSFIWIILMLIAIFNLNLFWAFLTFINFCLCTLNLFGYYQCINHRNKNGKQNEIIDQMGKI